MERTDLVEVGLVELGERPLALLQLRRRDLLRRVDGDLEQEVVGVAEDHRPAELGEAIEHLARLVAALDHVAEADRVLDAETAELTDDRGERAVVAVCVGDEPERHRSTIGRP
jgi:hypothetical protein